MGGIKLVDEGEAGDSGGAIELSHDPFEADQVAAQAGSDVIPVGYAVAEGDDSVIEAAIVEDDDVIEAAVVADDDVIEAAIVEDDTPVATMPEASGSFFSLANEEPLIQEKPEETAQKACVKCHAQIKQSAVICMTCGFHQETGQALQTQVVKSRKIKLPGLGNSKGPKAKGKQPKPAKTQKPTAPKQKRKLAAMFRKQG